MSKQPDMFDSLAQGDAEGVRAALRNDPEAVNRPDPRGHLPLFCAVRHPEIVGILLGAGAAVDERSSGGETALHAAADQNAESVRMLLAAGADPNARTPGGRTPIHAAASHSLDVVALLLEAGADPTLAPDDGVTALALAAGRGEVEMARLLLARGADARCVDKHGRTPLHEVARARCIGEEVAATLDLLVEAGADPGACDDAGDTPLHLAARRSYIHALEPFLQARVRAPLEARNHEGCTPLHEAPPNAPCTAALLAAGADIEARDNEGNTPLIESCRATMAEASEVLLQHGADKDACNHAGITPLHAAARQGSQYNVALLLEAGASPEARDAEGHRPIDLAFGSDKVQEMLARAMGLDKIERLRLGFVIEEGSQVGACVKEVLPLTPALYLKGRLDLRGYDILTYEQEQRGWAFRAHHCFDDEDTAESMVRRVNPFWGQVRPADYDDVIVIGRYFGFCKGGAHGNPAFLSWLGIERVPAILPRFGINERGQSALDLHLEPFGRHAPAWPSLAVLSTTRPVYAPGSDVPIFALCLHADGRRGGQAEVHLRTGGVEVPKTRRSVDLKAGLAGSTWKAVPQGQYTAVLTWEGNEARCTFTVGSYSLSLARAEWVDGPRSQDGHWQGTARLFVRGAALAPGVTVEIGDPKDERQAITHDDGLLDVDLPCDDQRAMRGLRLGWRDERDDVAHLPLPVTDAVVSGGVRVSAAAVDGSQEVSGLHYSVAPLDGEPLRLLRPCGEVAAWEAVRDVEAVAVTLLFAGREPETRSFGPLRAGQRLEVDLARAGGGYGFLCVGILAGGEVFEAAVPFARPSTISVTCEAPREAVAGQSMRVTAQVDGKPAAVAVVVQDARLHCELERDAAAARLDELRRASGEVEGPPPPLFSAAWLDGTFLVRPAPRQERHVPHVTGTILVDLLPTTPSPPSLFDALRGAMGLGAASPPDNRVAATTASATGTRVDPPVEEPPVGETVFADLVKVKRGRIEVAITAPTRPCTLSVLVLAVDAVRAAWVSSRSTVRVRAPIELYADAMPPAMLPDDAGVVTGRLSVESAVGPVALSATVDGAPARLDQADGPLLVEPPRDVRLALRPGLFIVHGSAGGHEVARTFRVRRADVVTERVRRMVALAPGQAFRIGPSEIVHDLQVVALDEIVRGSGRALTDYEYKCCEQTAAAMFGSWGMMFGRNGHGRLEAWNSMAAGLRRLETMWRGDGFALYPHLGNCNKHYGRQAYLHLLAMQAFRRRLGEGEGGAAVLAMLDDLVGRCRGVYGMVPNGRVASCHEAWLAGDERREEALAYVSERWRVEHRDPVGLIGCVNAGDRVATRAETCYAGAVLLADEDARARRTPEIQGTMAWLGAQMREGGRLYSSLDSSALIALLAEASRHFFGPATISIDGGPALEADEARAVLVKGLPREVACLEGHVHLLVDSTSETAVHVGETDAFSVRFEIDGARIEEAPLGAEVEMIMDAGAYRDGMLAHFVLPPCLALEEGGTRLQAFQRDFEGASSLRLRVRAAERSGGGPWHGVAVLQNLFVEEQHVGQRIGFKVV